MRVGVKIQMMTVTVNIQMERITSTYVQEVKSKRLGDYLVVGRKVSRMIARFLSWVI